jgi:hypothetical protein
VRYRFLCLRSLTLLSRANDVHASQFDITDQPLLHDDNFLPQLVDLLTLIPRRCCDHPVADLEREVEPNLGNFIADGGIPP